MIIAYVDRANISVVLALPEFKQLFNLSDSQRGNMNSAFFWTYAFLQVPAGMLVDRFGVKWPYAISFVFWSLTSAAMAFAGSVNQILGLRMLLGVGEAVITPASVRWIRFNIPEQQRGLAMGIYMAGTKYGPGIGHPAATFLSVNYGWQNMFLILGLGCLIWLVPWLTLVKNDDRELATAAAAKQKTELMPFSHVFSSLMIYGVILGTFCYNYFVFFCLTWLPSYLIEHRGMTKTQMGWISFAGFSGMATVAIFGGWLADRMVARGNDPIKVRRVLTLLGFAIASLELVGALSSSPSLATAMTIISLSGLGLATANYWALTQSLIPDAGLAGRVAGVQNFASNFSGIVAPLLTGWLLQASGSYIIPTIVVGCLLIIGFFCYLFIVRAEYAPKPYLAKA